MSFFLLGAHYKMSIKSPIGDRIYQARRSVKVTQLQLGASIGIDINHAGTRICSYELGRTEPKFYFVKKIASQLGFPVEFFYSETNEIALLLKGYYELSVKDRKKVSGLIEELAVIKNKKEN